MKTTTQANRLGHSTVEVTRLGFGGGPLDTSPHYGIGHSERRVGDLLRTKPREAFTLSTKVGRLLVPQDPAGRMDEGFEAPATHRRVWDFSRAAVRRRRRWRSRCSIP